MASSLILLHYHPSGYAVPEPFAIHPSQILFVQVAGSGNLYITTADSEIISVRESLAKLIGQIAGFWALTRVSVKDQRAVSQPVWVNPAYVLTVIEVTPKGEQPTRHLIQIDQGNTWTMSDPFDHLIKLADSSFCLVRRHWLSCQDNSRLLLNTARILSMRVEQVTTPATQEVSRMVVYLRNHNTTQCLHIQPSVGLWPATGATELIPVIQ